MKLVSISLHEKPTVLVNKRFVTHEEWLFDISFQLDLEEVIAFSKCGVKLQDLTIDNKGLASMSSVVSVASLPGVTRSKDEEKVSASKLLTQRFLDLQKQIEETSEYKLLAVNKTCTRRLSSFIDRMHNIKDEIQELTNEYSEYRLVVVSAMGVRDQLSDAQIDGLFSFLDTVHLDLIDKEMMFVPC
ncbi:hypothetical protein [Vulcanococcus sp.]|uniref:hypothetical protein n=1 Tax=Vulcanococcus sp. TaxID=2856995 RepID=UPI003F69B4EE